MPYRHRDEDGSTGRAPREPGDRRTPAGHLAARTSPAVVTAAWALVGAPLAWGVWQTLLKAAKLFTG